MSIPSRSASVRIDLAERSYDISVGCGLLTSREDVICAPASAPALIVTNTIVAPLYADALRAVLAGHHAIVHTVVLPDGEAHKDWSTLNLIFDALLGQAFDRKAVLYALGGGVVGDMTGFAAACYMRGVSYVQLPTTLLAQVDSSVGGKTAVNHPAGKNMIGAFHQPLRVIADLDTLDTLPAREISAGLAEVIKYGPIADLEFLAWTEHHIDALRARDKSALAHAVARSCEIKAAVVGQDERESNIRAILNFGHTFAHAIEAGLGFGEWLHGEAVGCGMVMAAALSARCGRIDPSFVPRLERLVERAGLPARGPRLGSHRYLELMQVDKKAEAGRIRFVLLDGPGKAGLFPVDDEIVTEVIEAYTA